MRLGMIGLGKMGGNMATRLVRGGHEVVGYDPDGAARAEVADDGVGTAESVEELVAALPAPRTVWVMVPAGEITQSVLDDLGGRLDRGDLVVDGGNAFYKDTLRRARELRERGIHLVDAGTSGGVWGLEGGYSLMVGGDDEAIERLRPVLETLAPSLDTGWGHVGPTGSGHFVKMVHNGIEYGMMQAYAEGFAILERKEEFGLDLGEIARIWRHGSVIRSWLLDLAGEVLERDQELADVAPYVPDSGEGRWTVAEAIELDSPAPVITLALIQRLRSRDERSYPDRLLSALRNAFGGHAMKREVEEAAEAVEPPSEHA